MEKKRKKNPSQTKWWICAAGQQRETHQLYQRRCLISMTQNSAPAVVAVCLLIALQLALDQTI